MEGNDLDNCLSIGTKDDAYKEKRRIAEVAAATLCRLNGIIKQMKDWRDDRVKLRSNIWRLKLALRVANKETDDTLHGDPLIEHQRKEIKRLEEANQALRKEIAEIKTSLIETDYDDEDNAWNSSDKMPEIKQEYFIEKERLNNEILYLKSRLREVEEGHEHSSELEHLKCKLKHFMMVDHTMEIIFTDIVNKVAETIANLSEELVNMNEHLYRSKLKNDNLYTEIDKLKAVLRFKSGSSIDYQKRIAELGNLTKHLTTEFSKFKANLGDKAWSKDSDYQNNLRNAERLANDLKIKLKHDHEAMLAAGDPDCLKYIKKIANLRVILKQLHIEFSKSNQPRLQCIEKPGYHKYSYQMSVLEATLKQINVEIDNLKDDHVQKHCRIGGIESVEYLKKIEELQVILEKAKLTMNSLNGRSVGKPNDEEDIEKLENSVDKVCHEIKQLEMIVVSNDCTSLYKRIEQLEESIVRLRVELSDKDERVKALHEQRNGELKNTQKKISTLSEENKSLKGIAKKLEEKTWELQREQECLKKELEQMQQVKHEANVTRKKLQNLQVEKEGVARELVKMREILQKKNDETKSILADKEATERILNSKVADLRRNLQVTSREKEKLQTNISDFERKLKEWTHARKGSGDMKHVQVSTENNDELERLAEDLETSEDNLRNANREIIDLKARLDHFSSDKARLESNISQLESKKELLIYQLGVEKATLEGRKKDLTKLVSEYDEMNDEKCNLMNERERLKAELKGLKAEKELLERSMGDVNVKHSKLEDEVNKYKSECTVLKEQIRNFEISSEDLVSKLEEVREKLNGAVNKIKRLELENSTLGDNLNEMTFKKSGLENRVRRLLTETSELTKRIKALDEENVVLKDQVNKVKTENESSSVELNKLQIERDKAKSENRSVQNAFDETQRNNEMFKRMNEELRIKLNEVYSEYRILQNQSKVLEMTNAALQKEKKSQRDHLHSLRSAISKMAEEREAITGDGIFSDHVEQTGKAVVRKVENETKHCNAKLDKRSNDKTKTKDVRDEMKKLIVENEALKFELLNLRSQSAEMKTDMSYMKKQLQKQKDLTANTDTSDTPVSNKVEVLNLYYKEVNSFPIQYLNGSLVNHESEIEIEGLLEIINKLKVENVALKMEVNTLRYNFVVNFAENEKKRNELWNALEEIQALKAELKQLRDEKESLRVRLDTAATKLDQLETERTALKDELFTLRKTNSDLTNKAYELRCNYQKLKETNVGFKGCVMGAIKKIKTYTLSSEGLDNLNSELKTLLKEYITNEELVQSIHEQKIDSMETCTGFTTT